MRRSGRAIGALVVCVLVAVGSAALSGQTPAKWSPPRTADGHPDLQGYWTNDTYTPLERPDEAEGQGVLHARGSQGVPEEPPRPADRPVARRTSTTTTRCGRPRTTPSRPTCGRRSSPTRRDGKLPPLTAAAQAARGARACRRARAWAPPTARRCRTLAERCITWGNVGPPMIPPTYNANFQILQSRDQVVIRHEMMHDVRLIPLDGRPRPAARVQQLAGDRPRPLGRRHAGGRHHQLHGQDQLPRLAAEHPAGHLRQRDAARRRAVHAGRPRHHPLSVHGRGPVHVDAALVGRDAAAALRGADLRVRLPRRATTGWPNILRAARVQEAAGQTVDAPTPFNRFAR